ncbi:MAG: hypothetical protein Q9192_007882, partial [Flavoplaca navasiana]
FCGCGGRGEGASEEGGGFAGRRFWVGRFVWGGGFVVGLFVVRLILFLVMLQSFFGGGIAAGFLDMWSVLVFDSFSFFDHEGSEEEINTEDAKANAEDGIVARVIVDNASEERGDE